MARGRSRRGSWYPRYTPSAPRKAPGGIVARSKRGDIGESWWSRRFVEALEAFTDPKRLGRGRRYARSGQVMDLNIEPGKVTSRVQGSRRAPYRVAITFAPLAEADWAIAEGAMAERAVFLASLLAGEMPRDIEDAFGACDLGLFPTSAGQLHTQCSCPDWANPCKHIAATYYILAERFDEDPFLILAWRGRDRGRLLANLRALRARDGDDPGRPEPADPAAAAERATEPLTLDPSRFWRAGAGLDDLRFDITRPEQADSVLREIGPPPADLAGLDPVALLSPAYLRMAEEVWARARGAEEPAVDGEDRP